LSRGCLGGFRGYKGVSRVYFMSETAQVETKRGGRVQAPARQHTDARVLHHNASRRVHAQRRRRQQVDVRRRLLRRHHVEAAQVEIETKTSNQRIILQFQALSSRRFQLEFDRVNLHRPTTSPANTGICAAYSGSMRATMPFMWRRKLNLKPKLESGSSNRSFKRLVPGGLNLGFIGSTCTALP